MPPLLIISSPSSVSAIPHDQRPAEFMDRILSPAEVMEVTGLGRSTIERARKDGELRFIQLTPRRVGLRMSELEKWLASRELAALKGFGGSVTRATRELPEGSRALTRGVAAGD